MKAIELTSKLTKNSNVLVMYALIAACIIEESFQSRSSIFFDFVSYLKAELSHEMIL